MKQKLLISAILSFMPLLAMAQSDEAFISIPTSEIGKIYKAVSYNRTSVHDPSIVVDNSGTKKKYYVYGSHRASAYTYDLTNWTTNEWSYGIKNANGTVTQVDYKKAFLKNLTTKVKVLKDNDTVEVDFGNFDAQQWRYTEDNPDLSGCQWAPDVIWNPYMKKWCLYMSLNGDDWRSVIALMTADKITGPYLYQGPVVFSGFHWTDIANQTWKQTDIPLVLGDITTLPARYTLGKSWGNRWPNNIDPCVFFDDDDQLWMAYGSWSGGIFILKLNRENGLRDYTTTYRQIGSGDDITQDPYFGKKIAGGHYVSGEGSYIEKVGKYYYLFMSYGGLTSDGGYEMRYYRSLNPNGDYKDCSSNSAVFSSYKMNYGPSATSNAGNRIFGSYFWQTMDDAELAQGHNSVLQDDDGRVYLVYHTRYANGGEGHTVKVHQMFLNSTNWLVASPYEFTGCTLNQDSIDSRQLCSNEEIVGTYSFIIHPYKLDYKNKAYQTPCTIHLTADGKVTGDYTGTWKIATENTSYITLRLAKAGSSSQIQYSGVVLPQTVSRTNMPSVCFMAVSQGGVAIWGSNVNGRYAVDYNYQRVKDIFPVKAYEQIKGDIDFTLPTYLGAEITWTSSRPSMISNDGKLLVTPTTAKTDSLYKVVLTCRICKDDYYYDAVRTVRVRCSAADAIEDVQASSRADVVNARGVYDLNGRCVLPDETKLGEGTLQRGIYVIGGRKVLIKD